MRVLYIEYALWKSIVQARDFAAFHEVIATDTRKVWAGMPEIIYATDIEPGADFTDWQANFEPASTLVPDEDSAIANITGLGATLQPRSADGTPQTAGQQLTLGQAAFTRIDDGTEVMNVDGRSTGTPVNVWDGTGAADTGTNDWAVNGEGAESAAAVHTGTNGWDSGVTTDTNDITRFSDPGGDSDIAGTYAELRFWMQPKAFPAGARLRVEWQKADNTQNGATLNVANYVSNMDLDVWQEVAIPIADFGLTEDVSRIRFRYRNAAGQQFWFDDISLVPVGAGPYRFRIVAPPNTRYHISMIVCVVAGPSSGWDADTFANIPALPLGLNLRQRRLSTGDVLWRFNTRNNAELFGRYHPQDDIEFADGTLLVGFMVKPGKASVIVTDDDVLEFVVRDDLSALEAARAFAHFGTEIVPL